MLYDLLQTEDDATCMIANMRRYVWIRRWWNEHGHQCRMHSALYRAMKWNAPWGRSDLVICPDEAATHPRFPGSPQRPAVVHQRPHRLNPQQDPAGSGERRQALPGPRQDHRVPGEGVGR